MGVHDGGSSNDSLRSAPPEGTEAVKGSRRQIAERYEVLRPLPRGGSGAEVYLANRIGGAADQLFVVKHFDATTVSASRIRREKGAVELARAAGRVLGLVADSEEGPAGFWYSMPYFDGRSLNEVVIETMAAHRELPEHYVQQVVRWMLQIAEQTVEMHRSGVIHKDIKPANLAIDGSTVRLIDIGLLLSAHSEAALTASGTEYYRDREIDSIHREGRSVRESDPYAFDVYSLGAVLYFLLEGRHPIDGARSVYRRKAPPILQYVTRRAMAKSSERYLDAAAFLADLRCVDEAVQCDLLWTFKIIDLPSGSQQGVPSQDEGIVGMQPAAGENSFFGSRRRLIGAILLSLALALIVITVLIQGCETVGVGSG